MLYMHSIDIGAEMAKVEGNKFNFYGVRKFYTLFSYFDALRAMYLEEDLDYINNFGFEGIRIMLNWFWNECPSPTIFDLHGNVNQNKLDKLYTVLAESEERKMIVDISFYIPNHNYSSPSDGSSMEYSSFLSGIKSILTSLKEWYNDGSLSGEWIFDLGNEHNSFDGWTESYIQELSLIIRNYFGNSFPFSASTTGSDYFTPCTISRSEGTNVIAHHFTTDRLQTIYCVEDSEYKISNMIDNSDGKPVYMQQPQRISTIDSLQYFIMDYYATVTAGGAAWCFHTPASYVLNNASLSSILNQDKYLNELNVLRSVNG